MVNATGGSDHTLRDVRSRFGPGSSDRDPDRALTGMPRRSQAMRPAWLVMEKLMGRETEPVNENETRDQAAPPSEAPEAQRNLGAMLLNDANSVIVDGTKLALGIGIAKALDRRHPPDPKPPEEGDSK